VSEGVTQGLGLHTPAGVDREPALQDIVKLPLAVYPVAQTGVQTPPLDIGEEHDV
jgi:hypothetical protein